MTGSAPPRKLERLVALLVPPARREEVLGDLYERYKSPAQYAADAAVTVPQILASQIRRTSDPGVVLLEALALYFCFFPTDGRPGAAGFFQQPQLLRILIQVACGLFGLRLADAYMTARSLRQLSLRATTGAGLACLSQIALSAARPDLALSSWALFRDGGLALMALSLMQMANPAYGGGLTPASAGEARKKDPVRRNGASLDPRSRGRSLWAYFAPAFVFLAFGLLFAVTQNRDVRIGAALLLFLGLWRVLSRPRPGSGTKPSN